MKIYAFIPMFFLTILSCGGSSSVEQSGQQMEKPIEIGDQVSFPDPSSFISQNRLEIETFGGPRIATMAHYKPGLGFEVATQKVLEPCVKQAYRFMKPVRELRGKFQYLFSFSGAEINSDIFEIKIELQKLYEKEILADAELKPDYDLLSESSQDEFRARCGTTFIAGLQRGHRLELKIRVEGVGQKEKSDFISLHQKLTKESLRIENIESFLALLTLESQVSYFWNQSGFDFDLKNHKPGAFREFFLWVESQPTKNPEILTYFLKEYFPSSGVDPFEAKFSMHSKLKHDLKNELDKILSIEQRINSVLLNKKNCEFYRTPELNEALSTTKEALKEFQLKILTSYKTLVTEKFHSCDKGGATDEGLKIWNNCSLEKNQLQTEFYQNIAELKWPSDLKSIPSDYSFCQWCMNQKTGPWSFQKSIQAINLGLGIENGMAEACVQAGFLELSGKLDLSFNKVGEIETLLPLDGFEFEQVNKVATLDVSGQVQLDSLKGLFGFSNLSKLSVAKTSISNFREVAKHFPKLVELNVNNPIDKISPQKLEGLGSLSNLVVLEARILNTDFHGYSAKDIKDMGDFIVSAGSAFFPQLRTLDIRHYGRVVDSETRTPEYGQASNCLMGVEGRPCTQKQFFYNRRVQTGGSFKLIF